MKLNKRIVNLTSFALAASFALLLASPLSVQAESEAGGFVIGGGSETGGLWGSAAANLTAGALWGEGRSESGGAADTGAESESGGVSQSASETESGGETMNAGHSEASYNGTDMNFGAYVHYYGSARGAVN